MSNTTSNAITKNYSGKFGNQFVFRNRNGKSILAALPVRTGDSPTEAQQNVRRKFTNASHYAKQILLDPEMLAAYSAKANDGQSPYLVAMSDYLRSPSVDEIDVEKYAGNPGDLVRVQASDDFKVTEVSLRIIDANGDVIEAGPCQLDTLGIWWEYTATVTVASLPGVEIIATARDIPGHTGE
ncbi:MAG: hypothetical protein V1766_14480, partial [Pseudomonadota bacterium]